MTLAAKKNWRYMMPLLALLDLGAGLALVALARQVAARWSWRRAALVCGLPVALQLAHALSHAPYFLTYMNPLSGGHAVAHQYIAFGWGEGLGLAARYMQKEAEGRPIRFHSLKYGDRLALLLDESVEVESPDEADFVLVTPRELEDFEMTPMVRRLWEARAPDFEARIFGVPYAWVFTVRPAPR
jgi:hypothetical protein